MLPLSAAIIEMARGLAWLWFLNNESCYPLLWCPLLSKAHMASNCAKAWLTAPRQRYAKYLWNRNLNEGTSFTDTLCLDDIDTYRSSCYVTFSKILNPLFVDMYLFFNSSSWKICHPTRPQLQCPKRAIWSSIHKLLNIIYLYRYFCVCLKMLIGVFV